MTKFEQDGKALAIIFGGRGETGVYVFDLETRRVLKRIDDVVYERWEHSAHKYNGGIYLYGGEQSPDKYMNDIWRYDI